MAAEATSAVYLRALSLEENRMQDTFDLAEAVNIAALSMRRTTFESGAQEWLYLSAMLG
jgi:hypothetical protein